MLWAQSTTDVDITAMSPVNHRRWHQGYEPSQPQTMTSRLWAQSTTDDDIRDMRPLNHRRWHQGYAPSQPQTMTSGLFFQKSLCFSSTMFNPSCGCFFIIFIYPVSIRRIHQDLSFNDVKLLKKKIRLRKISRAMWTPCLYQPSGNWYEQLHDDT